MKIERPEDVRPYAPWIPDSTYDRTLNNVCNYVRLLNNLGSIVEAMEVRDNDATADAFKPHLATYLKLLLTASYARKFLEVGSRYTNKIYYLDVLSASGLTYPGGAQTPVPGSCFWVPLAYKKFEEPQAPPKYSFSRVWTFDENAAALELLAARRDRLVERAGLALPTYEYVPGEVNASIGAVLDRLAHERRVDQIAGSRGSLTLAFIDNLGARRDDDDDWADSIFNSGRPRRPPPDPGHLAQLSAGTPDGYRSPSTDRILRFGRGLA